MVNFIFNFIISSSQLTIYKVNINDTFHYTNSYLKETFSDDEAAEIMNSKFINIKVDREERPDVDELYMKSLVFKHLAQNGPDYLQIQLQHHFPLPEYTLAL